MNLFSSAVKPISVAASTDKDHISIVTAKHTTTNGYFAALWINKDLMLEDNLQKYPQVSVRINAQFTNPVYIDIASGNVYNIPVEKWQSTNGYTNFSVPVYDYPIIIAERNAVNLD